MSSVSRRLFLQTSCVAAGAWATGNLRTDAAVLPGVETVALPLLTGEEQSAQPDIWALEVRYKPVRMIYVELTDPRTRKSSKQLVWYLAYRALVRNSSHLSDDSVGTAERPMFVPELTLVREDSQTQKAYADRVIPEAVAAINRRERHTYLNAVDIVRSLPAITPDRDRAFQSLDGVATWVGVDPDTDYFSVYLTGFSNGYQFAPRPDAQSAQIVLRRTLVQKFWRPSDRFEQSEDEIRLKDDPKWIYR